MMNRTTEFATLGCRLNAYESEAMREMVEVAGLDNLVVINTCAVTGEAVRKSRQTIRRCRNEFPNATLVVTGCAAQIDPDGFAEMDGVDVILGNSRKLLPETWHGLRQRLFGDSSGRAGILVDDIMEAENLCSHMLNGFGSRSTAYVQVQNGCDHRCTFCIIPFGRGNSRSAPAGAIVDQIRLLVERDFNEIVLTGVDLTSWGKDLPGQPGFGNLVKRILKLVPELPRLRLSSVDPAEIDTDLLEALATEPRLMPHLHLSLQSGDDLILKRMKRRHSRIQAVKLCEEARRLRPNLVFGADIIAGFPTESEAMFRNTLELVEDCDLTWLHVFPYSARKGTPAARMPQVTAPEIKERARRLRIAGEKKVIRYLREQVGRKHSVLMESPTMGRSEQYSEVKFENPQQEGRILKAVVVGHTARRLEGMPEAA